MKYFAAAHGQIKTERRHIMIELGKKQGIGSF